jgi:hypothetical protein
LGSMEMGQLELSTTTVTAVFHWSLF